MNNSNNSSTISIDELLCYVDIYCVKKYYSHLERVSMKPKGMPGMAGATATFWHSFALTMQEQYTEAMRDLNELLEHKVIQFAAYAALVHVHKASHYKDKDAVVQAKERLKNLSRDADNESLLFAARFFWHSDKAKQARQCIEKVLKAEKKTASGWSLYGWLSLSERGSGAKDLKSLSNFENSLKITAAEQKENSQIGENLHALLGRAIGRQRRGNYAESLQDLNRIITYFPNFDYAIMDKANVLMIMKNWEESLATATRALYLNPLNIDALLTMIVHLLAKDANPGAAVVRMAELMSAIMRVEPKNAFLLYKSSKLCARLANRNVQVLGDAVRMVQAAIELEPTNAEYVTEHAFQVYLMNRPDESGRIYEEATRLNETNLDALYGAIRCKIVMGDLQNACKELQFLGEVAQGAQFHFLTAQIAWRKDRDQKTTLEQLSMAVEAHKKKLEDQEPGLEYFAAFDPGFILDIVKEYMQHMPTEPAEPGDQPSSLLTTVVGLLSELTDLLPGLSEGQLLLARVSYIAGSFADAERALAVCLTLDSNCADAHMISAQINMSREQFPEARAALDLALSVSFLVQNTPQYMIIKAALHEAQNQIDQAEDVLSRALNMPGIKTVDAKNSFALGERVSIFLGLARILQQLGKIPEATKVMADAAKSFEGTVEKYRVTLAEVELGLRRQQYDRCIITLGTIPASSTYYIRARVKLAEIYIKHKRNKNAFSQCYQELATELKSVHGYTLLGQAYMRVQEPERAILSFERALELDPENPALASRIGRTLVMTHDYARAAQYYEAAAAKGGSGRVTLLHELADLYNTLNRYEDSLRVLNEALSGAQDSKDNWDKTIENVRTYLLMAKVQESAHQLDERKTTLTNALRLQQEVLTMPGSRSNDIREKQRNIASQICYLLAQYYKTKGKLEEALTMAQQALKYNEGDQAARLCVAQIYMLSEQIDLAQQQVTAVIASNKGNQEASMMLSDIMFRKNEHEHATYHFQDLLQKNPTQYDALEKLIRMLRRAGRLEDAQRFLKQAEWADPNATSAAGYNYCVGLFQWHSHEPRVALNHYNQARKHGIWGKKAIMDMIEIYLNPDNKELFSEVAEAKSDVKAAEQSLIGVQRLLQELTAMGESDKRVTILQAYALMATKQRAQIDQAFNICKDLFTSSDGNYLPAMLAMATCHMINKDKNKAKGLFKSAKRLNHSAEHWEENEKMRLMMAQIMLDVDKKDMADTLCKQVLNDNKSCVKAYMIMGSICEGEGSYKTAAEHYERAWHFSRSKSPEVGFLLAFNYLKDERWIEAINVCHKVIEAFPDYPKIREQILVKARIRVRE